MLENDRRGSTNALAALMLATFTLIMPAQAQDAEKSYDDLLQLFEDWREFESPPMRDGAPDYTRERFAAAYKEFGKFKQRLESFDIGAWPISEQVDWHIVRAEMNGFDFNHRVLQPWVRDPAFYQSIWTHRSDVPAHEGPTHHAVLELWTYSFPLSRSEERRMLNDLQVIPPLMKQAQRNLSGNARDLWIAGINNIEDQREHLDTIESTVGSSASRDLVRAVRAAQAATDDLIRWLQKEAPSKTGPSGIGKENYNWYLQQVHYVPMTWDDEVLLLRRELDRAWSSLKLEEHRNRNLPEQVAAKDEASMNRLADETARSFMRWLENNDIMPVKSYHEPALREHLSTFVPLEMRNFFSIVTHYDPRPLYSHFYHWFDLAQMEQEPHESSIRSAPRLYNIFDSRNEGTATGVEEMFMHAGLYDDTPRSRELVWIMLAQRAARGLGSLYAHSNDMTMAEAGTVHVKWTPRGWMGNEPELMKFEQQLYLRQPGYGTSYVTGKYLLEKLVAYRSRQLEEEGIEFELKEFFREFNEAGSVPTSLIQWQLTGDDSYIREIMDAN
ncbi:MAG: hypothetical protein WD448_13675 [Woeseia sp.]